MEKRYPYFVRVQNPTNFTKPNIQNRLKEERQGAVPTLMGFRIIYI